MKKYLTIIFAALFAILLTACSSGSGGNAYQTVSSDTTGLEMDFPQNWSSGSNNPAASIEMYSPMQIYGVTVIEEPMADYTNGFSIDDFTSNIAQNYVGIFNLAETPSASDVVIGGNTPAKQFEMAGEAENTKLEYQITCAGTKGYFFQIGAVTAQSRYDKAKPIFDDILGRVNFDNVVAGESQAAGSGANSGAAPDANVTYQTISSSESGLTIDFPKDWKESHTNTSASIEMDAPSGFQGILVLEEIKSDFSAGFTIDSYTSLVLDSMQGLVDSAEVSDIQDTQVGAGIPAKQFVISGEISGIKYVYLVTCIESNDRFYQLDFWATNSQYDASKPVFDDILTRINLGD